MRESEFHIPDRSILLRTLGTAIAVILLVYLLSQQGWDEIWAAIQKIPLWRLGLAFMVMVISRLAVSVRWHILLRSTGVKISLGQSMRINFAGLFASNFLPTTVGGDVIRLAGALRLSVDTAVSTASLVVDRLIGMAGMAMAIPFGLPRFLQVGALQHIMLDEPGYFAASFAALPLGGWWKTTWDKGLKMLQRMLAALALWLKQPRSLFAALVITWVHMLCLFTVLALLFDGMGEHLSILMIGGLYSLVYFFTLIPISINGYGLQELSMTVVFSSLGGASLSTGLTAALLFRTLMMLASLPGVAFIPEMLPGTKRS
jgi:uncharacterized membrane protein YbhN (UPF0104 family)